MLSACTAHLPVGDGLLLVDSLSTVIPPGQVAAFDGRIILPVVVSTES